MSLEESFYSTMFPVYVFAGLFLSGYAMASILVIVFRRLGYLKEQCAITISGHGHLDDGLQRVYGLYRFSQYMLIWYANLPIEIVT